MSAEHMRNPSAATITDLPPFCSTDRRGPAQGTGGLAECLPVGVAAGLVTDEMDRRMPLVAGT